jgi:hypothetical protein
VDNKFLKKYRPDLLATPTTLGPQTTGDGIKLAVDVGADVVDMQHVQLHPTGFFFLLFFYFFFFFAYFLYLILKTKK